MRAKTIVPCLALIAACAGGAAPTHDTPPEEQPPASSPAADAAPPAHAPDAAPAATYDGRMAAADAAPAPAARAAQLSVGPFWWCVAEPGRPVRCGGGCARQPPAGLTAQAVAVARGFACAISNGTVTCWGNAPTGAPKITDAVELAVGDAHACVRNAAGAVTCWGAPEHKPPADLQARAMAATTAMTCAIAADDGVRCWGPRPAMPPADLKARRLALATQLSDARGGRRYGCAITTGDDVRCWGDAPGTTAMKAREIAAAEGFACATGLDGAVACWGALPRFGPRPPADKPTSLSASFRSAGALLGDGTPSLWGDPQ